MVPVITHIAACSSAVRLKKSATCRRGTTSVWPELIGKLSLIAATTSSVINTSADVSLSQKGHVLIGKRIPKALPRAVACLDGAYRSPIPQHNRIGVHCAPVH